MPIVFVHGVAVRSKDIWAPIELFLRRYVAPAISNDPEHVKLLPVFWYDLGMSFAWHGKSRPLSALTGQGAATPVSPPENAALMASISGAIGKLPNPPLSSDATSGLIGGAGSSVGYPALPFRLKDLTPAQLSDLAVSVVQAEALQADLSIASYQYRYGTIAADEVAYDPATLPALASKSNSGEELALLQKLIEDRYLQLEPKEGLIGQGSSWLQKTKDRLEEALSRTGDTPGFAVTQVLTEARRPLNALVARFFGDVFVYQTKRGTPDNPGPIPMRLLEGLKEAYADQQERHGEPLIVVTHSMGGQLVYDAVTEFLPQRPDCAGIRVDFWAAIASQVGYFEEMKLFLASKPDYGIREIDNHEVNTKVPFPDFNTLGEWWNVWDSSDFLSFTARDIFLGVDDQEYNTGMSFFSAHSGYFERPSFYRELAGKIKAAHARNWSRP